MRIVDLQMSLGGSAPAGAQAGALQAVQTYRFLRDVDHARKENLHRQESVVASSSAASSLRSQDAISAPQRTYVNRARRDPERRNGDEVSASFFERSSRRDEEPGQMIDFLA